MELLNALSVWSGSNWLLLKRLLKIQNLLELALDKGFRNNIYGVFDFLSYFLGLFVILKNQFIAKYL